MNYEAHITFHRDEAPQVQTMASFSRWSFSAIDGDPVLGKGVWCYLTANDDHYDSLLKSLRVSVERAKQHGMHPLRGKIESIEFDERYDV